jgi:hypothetical protein
MPGDRRRLDLIARGLLTAAALLPYWRLLTFSVIFVTDDYFASDIFNGELPGRVLAGQLLRAGHLPVWTSQICSGFPLTGAPAEPIGLSLFALLPPAPALDALIVILLLVAAHGSYALARRFGADVFGAFLAGIAFAGSGYIACQLKHLSIVSTIVWVPVGMLLIDHALAPRSRYRWSAIAAFGLVFAEQVLSGFPQSVYIAALTYGAFALFRALLVRTQHPAEGIAGTLSGLAVAIVLGAAAGAVLMLPLSALGGISDRAEPLGYDWSTRLAYWVPNIKTFLLPYANGDISNNTYAGPPFFWEDYGYVGALTFLLALYGTFRERRRPLVVFTFALTVLAYLFVLGRSTPVFHAAYVLVPGLKLFRFPTRFLFVVDLGLALLGAFGLTRLRADVASRCPAPSRVPLVTGALVCGVTVLDLFVHQPRQNPMVPADAWLAPPPTVALVRGDTVQPRTFTPRHRDVHRGTFLAASGWANVEPYYQLRDALEPNLGGAFWDVPSGDCYVGLSPRWYVDVWGDHNRELSLMSLLSANDFAAGRLRVRENFPAIMRAYGVTHVIGAYPLEGAPLPFVGRAGGAYVYRVDGSARVRIVPVAHRLSDRDAAQRLLDPSFDPTREVLIQDAPADARIDSGSATNTVAGTAAIVSEGAREMTIRTQSSADAFLLLADTYYPGWTATIDGQAAPVYRANLSVRALALPPGTHEVRFHYDPPGFRLGLLVSTAAMALLILWLTGALYGARRSSLRAAA